MIGLHKRFSGGRKEGLKYGCGRCQTMVLPCLTDCDNLTIRCDLSVREKEYYDFIYPGAATNKDSLEGMLKGLLLLNEDERRKVRFHFTTLKPNKLIEAANCSEEA